MPDAGFLQFYDEADQYSFAYVLRPGEATATDGVISLLKRTISKLRKSFGRAKIRVRLDGGYSTPEVLEFLDEQEGKYVVAIAENSVLKAFSEPLMIEVTRDNDGRLDLIGYPVIAQDAATGAITGGGHCPTGKLALVDHRIGGTVQIQAIHLFPLSTLP